MYCPRCGAGLGEKEVDGRARRVCSACGYVVYRQLKVGAGALVEQAGGLLLVRRGRANPAFPDTWNLPSGYCEADEDPRVTAAREAAEETGLVVEAGRLVDAYFFDDDPRGHGLLLVYEARVVGGVLRCDGREAVEARFFPPDGLPEALCGGGHDQAIGAWQPQAWQAGPGRAGALDRWQPGELPRYCPHCARPLEERLAFERVRPACPACGFVHFRELKVGVSVVVEQEGRVLLVQRAVEPGLGQWCLPSGFVEWDEAPEAAAARECEEETGLAVEGLTLLEVSHYTDDYRGPGINLTYRARVAGGALRPGDDAGAVRFFAPGELPPVGDIAFRSHRVLLEKWRSDEGLKP